MSRTDREHLALDLCPAWLYYDLADGIENVPDSELNEIIPGKSATSYEEELARK